MSAPSQLTIKRLNKEQIEAIVIQAYRDCCDHSGQKKKFESLPPKEQDSILKFGSFVVFHTGETYTERLHEMIVNTNEEKPPEATL